MYPQNEQELLKFKSGIIESLHNDKTRPQIMGQLTDENIPIAARIGAVVSQVMNAMLVRVAKQTGQKPHLKLILQSIKMIVLEVSKMAEMAGIKVSQDDMRQAAQIAGDAIESGRMQQQNSAQNQGNMMQSQPQNGIINGAINNG